MAKNSRSLHLDNIIGWRILPSSHAYFLSCFRFVDDTMALCGTQTSVHSTLYMQFAPVAFALLLPTPCAGTVLSKSLGSHKVYVLSSQSCAAKTGKIGPWRSRYFSIRHEGKERHACPGP